MNVYWAESVRGCGIVRIDTIMGSSSPQCRPQRHLPTRASLVLLVAVVGGYPSRAVPSSGSVVINNIGSAISFV